MNLFDDFCIRDTDDGCVISFDKSADEVLLEIKELMRQFKEIEKNKGEEDNGVKYYFNGRDVSNLPDCCKFCANNKNAFCNCALPFITGQMFTINGGDTICTTIGGLGGASL